MTPMYIKNLFRRCWKLLTCGLISITIVSSLCGALVSIGLKFWGPETSLAGHTTISAAVWQPQEVSEFPYFCKELSVVSKSTVENTTITYYLGSDARDVNVGECFIEAIMNDSCSLFIPFTFGNILYRRINASAETDIPISISTSCTSRIWFYMVLSLTVFTIMLVCGLLCWCCCACSFYKAKVKRNRYIYQPLLNTGTETNPCEKQLKASCGNNSNSVTLPIHPTELSNSYKYSSFKPGTKAGGSHASRIQLLPREQAKSKPNYATISGTYTFNTFKTN